MVSAWVFVVWGAPKYLVGAVAGAASLRQVNTHHHVVLMWAGPTPDLLDEIRRSRLFDLVEETELLRFQVNPLRTRKQMELYGGEFSETANTKWQCLGLAQYEKVMFLDSDIVFRRNCDFLFSLRTPAATFSSPFSATYSKGGFPDPYRGLRHGQPVPRDRILQGLREATVCAGSMVLLTPSRAAQAAHIDWMRAREPYGHPGCFSAIDEQAITEFMLDRKDDPGRPSENAHAESGDLRSEDAHARPMWTHISPIYQAIPWKRWGLQDLPHGDLLDPRRGAFALHFYHTKVYEKGDGNDWPDTVIFWCMWHRFAREHPVLEQRVRALMEYYVAPEDMARVYGDNITRLCGSGPGHRSR